MTADQKLDLAARQRAARLTPAEIEALRVDMKHGIAELRAIRARRKATARRRKRLRWILSPFLVLTAALARRRDAGSRTTTRDGCDVAPCRDQR